MIKCESVKHARLKEISQTLSFLPVCQYLDLLLGQVCGIVEKHTDLPVLEACARLVSTLTSDNYTFSSRACRVFSQLLDGLAECFNSCLDDLLQVGGGQTPMEHFQILSAAFIHNGDDRTKKL